MVSKGPRAEPASPGCLPAGSCWGASGGVRLVLTGYRVLAQRYGTKLDEIGSIARRRDVVVFAEVKRRGELITGLDAVTPQARIRTRRAAEVYIGRNPALAERVLRFDVMVVTLWAWPRHIVDARRDN